MSTRLDPGIIGVVSGSTKNQRMKVLTNPQYKIFILNPEALRTPEIFNHLKEFEAELVVYDESHGIKNPRLKTPAGNATGTKRVFDISAQAHYRYILTGTPVTKDAQDLWSQYYFLDRGATFGDKFYHFKKKYFYDKNAGMPKDRYFPNWQFVDSLLPEVNRKLAATSARMSLEECVELPELTEQTIEVELTPEQKKHYIEIKNELITFIENSEDNPLVVKNALTKVLRLNELLSGYLKLEDGTVERLKKNPRLDALVSLIESAHPHKMIIFSVFKNNYEDIRNALDKLKIKYVEIHGGISSKNKLENVDLFNDLDNDIRICIANPQSGGVGVNLKAAKYRVFYTLNYSMKDYEQSKARNFRSGSIDVHKKILHYNMVTPNTIDERILEAIINKKDLANSLLDIKKLL